MIEVSVTELRSKTSAMQNNEILHVMDARMNKPIGYFIPETYAKNVFDAIEAIELQKRTELLQRVAKARNEDAIGDGAVGDGID